MKNSNITRNIYSGCMIFVALMIVAGLFLYIIVGSETLSASYIENVYADNMGMLTCGVLLLGLYASKNKDGQNHSMFRMTFSLTALFFFDLLSSYLEGHSDYIAYVVLVNTLAFILEDILGYTYWTYIRDELKLKGKFLRIANQTIRISLGISIFLDIINVKLGMFFTVSDAGEYVDSPYEFLGDIAIIAVFVMAAIAIIWKSEAGITEKLILMTFGTFPLSAYIVGDITQEYAWVYPAYLLSVLLIYIRIFSEREKKIAEQQVLLTKQNTALMISQIQPHFLYNVLTTISNLCVTDPEEAEETTVLFSQYLRTNLDSLRNQDPVPFATELGHIRTYVELEKKRFGDILNVEYEINEQNFKVPSLGLQPIVENSVKHGIRGKNAPGHIKIATYKVDNGYKIIIKDDGIGFDMNMPVKEDGKSHVGMTNVKERLRQMCNATMKVESAPGQGCCTEIIIPES